ncbi:DUF3305 domain-containing protein [Lutibaculum baratangense]|uniref:Molybdopterin-guanine dinucleotide biosynthesis protein A n=1 Tax=Lutibaculum baratangense AMV1 TaxID=631454 RepID=V4RBZ4_9HYPH|nr:DUF3305 domain-containing protein [Lutibaculum baratangense]ESR22879.1 hypothetical protein N177_4016 [Lutibaculum baratangense AMV1]
MSKAEHIPVTVLVERRAALSRWADEIFKPVAVVPGREDGPDWQEVPGRDGVTTFRAGSFGIELHPTEAEAYKYNLTMRNPSVLVVLVPAAGAIPWRLHLVTLSPYEAEAYLVAGDAIVEPVPIPEHVAMIVSDFADRHYKPEPFKKRKRDKAPGEEAQLFGKEPIFDRTGGRGGANG